MSAFVHQLPHLFIAGTLNTLLIGAIVYFLLLALLALFRNTSASFKYKLGNLSLLTIFIAFLQPFYNWLALANNRVTLIRHINTQVDVANTAILYNAKLVPAVHKPVNTFNSFTTLLEKHSNTILFIYLIGLFLFSLRILFAHFYSQQLKHNGILAADEKWTATLEAMSKKLGITRKINIAFTSKTISPCIIGYSKALILIPVALINNINTAQAEAILLHELAHFRQYDYYINLAIQILQCILFFNPFFWLIARICDKYREIACDDIATMHNRNVELAESLGIIVRIQFTNNSLALNLKAKNKSLIYRIQNLLQMPSTKKNNSGAAISILTLILTASLVLCCTTKSISQKNDLKSQLEQISKQMFDEGNEKFIVVDAVKDSLLPLGKPYVILYMSDNNLFINGKGPKRKLQGSELSETMSSELKGEYIEKLQEFRAKWGEVPNGVLDVGPVNNNGVTMQEILNPNSAFRKVNLADRYRAGIRTVAIRKMIRHIIDDNLAKANDSDIVYSFDSQDIVINHIKLNGEMKKKYELYFQNDMGIDLNRDAASGVWGKLCKLSDY